MRLEGLVEEMQETNSQNAINTISMRIHTTRVGTGTGQ